MNYVWFIVYGLLFLLFWFSLDSGTYRQKHKEYMIDEIESKIQPVSGFQWTYDGQTYDSFADAKIAAQKNIELESEDLPFTVAVITALGTIVLTIILFWAYADNMINLVQHFWNSLVVFWENGK